MTAYKIRYVLECKMINLRMYEKKRVYKIAVVYVLRMEQNKNCFIYFDGCLFYFHIENELYNNRKISQSLFYD